MDTILTVWSRYARRLPSSLLPSRLGLLAKGDAVVMEEREMSGDSNDALVVEALHKRERTLRAESRAHLTFSGLCSSGATLQEDT